MLIKLIQAHLENIDEGGILVFLDLEKAFDKCSWSYLHRALRALKFTTAFTSWTDILYDASVGTERQILANGFLTQLPVSRESRNGSRMPPQPPSFPDHHGRFHTHD